MIDWLRIDWGRIFFRIECTFGNNFRDQIVISCNWQPCTSRVIRLDTIGISHETRETLKSILIYTFGIIKYWNISCWAKTCLPIKFPKLLTYIIEIYKSDYLDHSIYVHQVYPCSAHIKRTVYVQEHCAN